MRPDLPKRCRLRALVPIADDRGSFLKVLMRQDLSPTARFGEIYLTSAVPGGVKGRHYHERTTEWFSVIRGRVTLWLRDLVPEPGEIHALDLSADDPCRILVPPGVAHAFQNRGNELAVILAYSDTPYDPEDPDVVSYDGIPASRAD